MLTKDLLAARSEALPDGLPPEAIYDRLLPPVRSPMSSSSMISLSGGGRHGNRVR